MSTGPIHKGAVVRVTTTEGETIEGEAVMVGPLRIGIRPLGQRAKRYVCTDDIHTHTIIRPAPGQPAGVDVVGDGRGGGGMSTPTHPRPGRFTPGYNPLLWVWVAAAVAILAYAMLRVSRIVPP